MRRVDDGNGFWTSGVTGLWRVGQEETVDRDL